MPGARMPMAAAAALAVAVPGLAAQPANAGGCGGVLHRAPSTRIDPAHRPPLAIGDSTMLLAVKPLSRIGFEANARGCRQMDEGTALLARLKRERRLSRVVLIHLGANAGITVAEIGRMLRVLGPKRILVAVTPRPGKHARAVRAAGRRWPKRVRVLDWVRERAGHRGWFSGDGLHLSDNGVRAFVRLCKPYLALARPPRPVRRIARRVRPERPLGR